MKDRIYVTHDTATDTLTKIHDAAEWLAFDAENGLFVTSSCVPKKFPFLVMLSATHDGDKAWSFFTLEDLAELTNFLHSAQ